MRVSDRVRITGDVRVWGLAIQGRVGKVDAVSPTGITVRLSHPPDPRVAVVCVPAEALTRETAPRRAARKTVFTQMDLFGRDDLSTRKGGA